MSGRIRPGWIWQDRARLLSLVQGPVVGKKGDLNIIRLDERPRRRRQVRGYVRKDRAETYSSGKEQSLVAFDLHGYLQFAVVLKSLTPSEVRGPLNRREGISDSEEGRRGAHQCTPCGFSEAEDREVRPGRPDRLDPGGR